jgi:hypothetical protein
MYLTRYGKKGVSNIMKKKTEPKVTVDIKAGKAPPAQQYAWNKFWQSVITEVNIKDKG